MIRPRPVRTTVPSSEGRANVLDHVLAFHSRGVRDEMELLVTTAREHQDICFFTPLTCNLCIT